MSKRRKKPQGAPAPPRHEPPPVDEPEGETTHDQPVTADDALFAVLGFTILNNARRRR